MMTLLVTNRMSKEVALSQRKFAWKIQGNLENCSDLVHVSVRSRVRILDGLDGDYELLREVVHASTV
jgi:hypothetical protein